MLTEEAIVELSRRYASATDKPLTTVSSRVFDDSKKLSAIESGKTSITVRRFNRSIQWFSDNWPEKAEWPDSIPRPSPASSEAAQ